MKHTKLFLSFLVIALFSIGGASAQKLHFIGTPTVTPNPDYSITVCGKLAGLGNNEMVTLTLTAAAKVTTTCTNPGGNIAPGQTKTETVSSNLQSFRPENGTVSFCLTTAAPTPGSCPNGQWSAAITGVSYSNKSLTVEFGTTVTTVKF